MPSQIRTVADLIAMLTLQKTNLPSYFVQCNATAADVTEVTNDLNNLNALLSFIELADGYKKGFVDIKNIVFDGIIGTPIPAFPPALVAPALALPLAGALTRARNRNRRFKAGPGYTVAIGEFLGIETDPTPPPDPGDVTPTILVAAAKADYGFAVIVNGREQADSWRVDAIPVGSNTRIAVGTATGKSADFIYHPSPAEAGQPVQIRVEVQLRKNNADYGHPSAEERITVNP
ncbi:MAG: hypothetical protein IPL32_01145 [Chloracidobacterium sp.]|nr:hypothetical protein [Chloracidobacterium sp.]